MKDNLIVHQLSSEDPTLKKKALSALALYCKLDKEEAISSWSLFTNAAFIASSDLKNVLLKGAFDILNCHGHDIFVDCDEEQLDSTVENLLLNLEDEEKERSIMVLGILKLYLAHYTWSPNILAKLVLLYFNPEPYHSTMKDMETFLKLYGKTKQEAECLCQTYLTVIDLLFDSNKNGPYHKISIKKVTLQLLEFGKSFENSKIVLEENFEDMVILKITKKFIKTPWRLPSTDLHTICNHIMPKSVDNMIKLKENIKLVIENMNSAAYQQTNPYTKKSTKQFSAFMKKIKNAINSAPLVFEAPKQPSPLEKRLFADPPTDESINSSKEVGIEVDSSPPLDASLDESEKSQDSDSAIPGTPEKSSSCRLDSQQTPATFKTPAPPAKTPAPRKTPAPSKTPASRKTPAPTKTPATRKTPAPTKTPGSRLRKTPATAKSRTAQKKVHEQVSVDQTYDQSEFCIENIDSD